MDPVTFGLGVLVGSGVNVLADAISKKFLWSDEQKALYAVYREQQGDIMRAATHARMISILESRIDRAEKQLSQASGTRAVRLEGTLAKLTKMHEKLFEEGPDVLRAPQTERESPVLSRAPANG